MGIESASDRAVFVSTPGFGDAATLTPQIGDAITLNGIFDNAYLAISMGGEAQVASTSPAFTCRRDDLATLAAGDARQGDLLAINAESWTVIDIQPDGTGMTVLILERA